jgi:hypothetical protein
MKMTFNDLANAISRMTPEQRAATVTVRNERGNQGIAESIDVTNRGVFLTVWGGGVKVSVLNTLPLGPSIENKG